MGDFDFDTNSYFCDKDRCSKMNRISEEKIEGAIEYSKGQPKGFKKPAVKELTITQDGIEFKVKYKLTSKYSALWKNYYQIREEHSFYDPAVVLKNVQMSGGYIDDGSGVYVSAPLADQIPEDTERLTAEDVDIRLKAFITVANKCAEFEVAAEILEKMPRKKNKTLHKGRILPIAFLNIVESMGVTYQIVAKNESDTELIIEMRNKVPVVDDLVSYPRDLQSSSNLFF